MHLFLDQTTFVLFHFRVVFKHTLVSLVAQICLSCVAFIKSIGYRILSSGSCNHKQATLSYQCQPVILAACSITSCSCYLFPIPTIGLLLLALLLPQITT